MHDQNNTLLRPSINIHIENYLIAYDQLKALEIPSLTVSGNIIALIGHNGSGKSTFIKSTLDLLPARAGHMHVKWLDNQTTLSPHLHMAYSPESGAVFKDISVKDYIKLWCRLKQGRSDYYLDEGRHIMEQLDIFPLLNKLGRELSKGQCCRVQAATGFLIEPLLFLFDEPFDGLDVDQSINLADILQEKAQQMCMLVSSHRLDVIERLADLIIVLREGKIVTYGSAAHICSELCERSLRIQRNTTSTVRVDRIFHALQQHYSDLLVSKIGESISITGNSADKTKIGQFLVKHQLGEFSLDYIRPSLTDAMSYHLKSFTS